jgi:hypothetical protein
MAIAIQRLGVAALPFPLGVSSSSKGTYTPRSPSPFPPGAYPGRADGPSVCHESPGLTPAVGVVLPNPAVVPAHPLIDNSSETQKTSTHGGT